MDTRYKVITVLGGVDALQKTLDVHTNAGMKLHSFVSTSDKADRYTVVMIEEYWKPQKKNDDDEWDICRD